jgi:hypothetical protein
MQCRRPGWHDFLQYNFSYVINSIQSLAKPVATRLWLCSQVCGLLALPGDTDHNALGVEESQIRSRVNKEVEAWRQLSAQHDGISFPGRADLRESQRRLEQRPVLILDPAGFCHFIVHVILLDDSTSFLTGYKPCTLVIPVYPYYSKSRANI